MKLRPFAGLGAAFYLVTLASFAAEPGVPATAGTATVQTSVPVNVLFHEPEKFTDVNERQFKSAPDKNQNLKELKGWLEKQAAKSLQPGQQLQITFNDIDLAGDFEPGRAVGANDVRIVKDIYSPRMKLHFRLAAADGAVINEGVRELRDMGFMMKSRSMSSESLRFDKNLLEDWLKKEFSPAS